MQLVSKKDPALRTVCDEVPHGEDMSELIDGMLKVMRTARGVGLAAPQVGECKRVVVIEYAAVKTAIINPVITKTPGKLVTSVGEGCLSYPGLKVDQKRHKRVIVEGFDRNWKPVRIDARNLTAFIVQHEVDHLNGVTIKNNPDLQGKYYV